MGGTIKTRFDSLDVMAMVSYIQRTCIGRRILNIYDVLGTSTSDTSTTGGGGGGGTDHHDSNHHHGIFALKLDETMTSSSTSSSTSASTTTSSTVVVTDASTTKQQQQQQAVVDINNSNKKEFIVIESGVRFHTWTPIGPTNTSTSTIGVEQEAATAIGGGGNGNDTNNATNTTTTTTTVGGLMIPKSPSPFCIKLRKHLRYLRLESIQQIQMDRVVLFYFVGTTTTTSTNTSNTTSSSSSCSSKKNTTNSSTTSSSIFQRYAIIVELYGKGNIILTNVNENYMILALLRTHQYEQGQIRVQVGYVYPIVYSTTLSSSSSSIHISLSSTNTASSTTSHDQQQQQQHQEQQQNEQQHQQHGPELADVVAKMGILVSNIDHVIQWMYEQLQIDINPTTTDPLLVEGTTTTTTIEQQQLESNGIPIHNLNDGQQTINNNNNNNNKNHNKKKDKNSITTLSLKTLLLKPNSGVFSYGPALIEHCILVANLLPHQPLLQPIGIMDHSSSSSNNNNNNKKNNKTRKKNNRNMNPSDITTPTAGESTTTSATSTKDGDMSNPDDPTSHIVVPSSSTSSASSSSSLLPYYQQLTKQDWTNLQRTFQLEAPRIVQTLRHSTMSGSSNNNSLYDGSQPFAIPPPGYILYSPRPTNKLLLSTTAATTTTTTSDSPDHRNPKEEDNHPDKQNVDPMMMILPHHADKILEEFIPILFQQHYQNNRLYIQYPNFAAAVTDFFACQVYQKQQTKSISTISTVQSKLERIKFDQIERIRLLQQEQEILFQEAQAVQHYANQVDNALSVINSALDSGMDWDQLEQVIAIEQAKNNPIALLIHQLQLEDDIVILALPMIMDDDDMISETAATISSSSSTASSSNKCIHVNISLKESAHGNAGRLYAKYRALKEKAMKTMESSNKALRAAEETANRQLKEALQRNTNHQTTHHVLKKSLWFEKFRWFITSDNYLVLGGRDAHQNEVLVKRYLRPGDAYLHADVHGAASCIVRAKRHRLLNMGGKTKSLPISNRALVEAGNFTICHSSAWSKRAIISAWWVESHQVSKTAPSGEYLSVGSFMVRGKKNFLPPCQLEMGLAIMFRLGDDPDTLARHKNERRDFTLLDYEGSTEDDDFVGNNKTTTTSLQDDATIEHSEIDTINQSNSQCNQLEVLDQNPTLDVDAIRSIPDSTTQGNDNEEEEQLEAQDDHRSDASGHSEEENADKNGRDSDENDMSSSKDESGNKNQRSVSFQEKEITGKSSRFGVEQEESNEKEHGRKARKGPETNIQRQVPMSMSEMPATTAAMNVKRGKKSKLKKVMKKYADQDDDDREFAMYALQGGEKDKKSKKRPGKRDNRKMTDKQVEVAAATATVLLKDASRVAKDLPDAVRDVLSDCLSDPNSKSSSSSGIVPWDKLDGSTLEQLVAVTPLEAQIAAVKRLLVLIRTNGVDNFSSALSGIIRTIRKYGHEGLQTDPNKLEQAKPKQNSDILGPTMISEQIGESDGYDDAVDDSIELNKLTGKIHNGDVLLFAVPVCAPYQTVSQYTYRVKLTPGNMKRGKAAVQCVDLMLKENGQNKDLIKKVTDNEWMQAICSDVKIATAGASKAIKKAKKKN